MQERTIESISSIEDVKEFLKKNYTPLVDQLASVRLKYDKQLHCILCI